MIRLVERRAAADGERESTLASAARGSLSADAVLVIELAPGAAHRILAVDGLSTAETELVSAAVSAGLARGRALSVPGFAMTLYEAVTVPAVGVAAVCALQRRPAAFKNPGLAAAFAQHAAIAGAARREDRRFAGPVAGDDALDLLGVGVLEPNGYGKLDEAISRAVKAELGAPLAGVFLWDDEDEVLRPVPGAFGSDPRTLLPTHAAHDWSSSVARVFATGEPYLTNRAEVDPGVLQDYVEKFAFERLITVPIRVGGRRIGVLQVANKASDFTLRDIRVADSLGPAIALGVHVARSRHALLRRHRFEEILGEVAIDIASGRDLQEFLGTALDSLCAALDGSLVMLVPSAGEPIVRRQAQAASPLETMMLDQARQITSLRVYGAGPRRAGEPGWSAAHVPVLLGGEGVATLSALRIGGSTFAEDECRALSRMASLVALAWETERYQRHLADEARVAECQRIADELHDHVAQLLFAARLSLDFAVEVPGIPEVSAISVRKGRDLLLRAEAATRLIMEKNSQDQAARFSDRLAELVGSIEEEFVRPVALEIAPAAAEAATSMSQPALNLVARAAREALVNAAKHAGPCQLAVRVTVTRRNRLLLTVTDGGIGVVSRREDGYGTAALRRAVRRHGGVLRVNRASTGGTRVAVSVPLMTPANYRATGP